MIKKSQKELENILTKAYDDYNKKLLAHAFFKVSDHEVSEDLVQSTFMKTWDYLMKGKKIDLMQTFLYKVLNNLIVDQYRSRKHKVISLDSLIESGYEPLDSVDNNINSTTDRFDAKVIFPSVIERLPSRYRKVIDMRYKQDLSITEISCIIQKSKNNVSVQVHRGLEKLKLLSADSLLAVQH